jgi:hypothetical protein
VPATSVVLRVQVAAPALQYLAIAILPAQDIP